MCTSAKKCLLSSLVLSLGCASARKLRLGQKHALFGFDTQLTIKGDEALKKYFFLPLEISTN
jgi:hypothetical protein